MLTRLNLKVILIVFYNSSNKSESKRSFSLSYYFNFIHVKTEFAKRINNCFENTLVLLRLRREGFPNFLLMLKKNPAKIIIFCWFWMEVLVGGPKIHLFENPQISNISETYSSSGRVTIVTRTNEPGQILSTFLSSLSSDL